MRRARISKRGADLVTAVIVEGRVGETSAGKPGVGEAASGERDLTSLEARRFGGAPAVFDCFGF